MTLRGWDESPAVSDEPVDVLVELEDADPIVLRNGVFDVVQCGWDEQTEGCLPYDDPTIDAMNDPMTPIPSSLPSLDDPLHADADDPLAAIQIMQFSARFSEHLDAWGWDSYA